MGGEGGRAWSNFPLFSFILPCEKIRVAAPRCFPPGAQRPGGFVPSLVSQTLISDSLPAPRLSSFQIHTAASPALAQRPRTTSRGYLSRAEWLRRRGPGDRPARPQLRGQRRAKAPGQSPLSRRALPATQTSSVHSLSDHKHPVPLVGAEQLVGE